MDYMDVHTFLTIVSCESLSKAADLLFVSQPALSHRLTKLEKELGVKLMVRGKGVRNIRLTEEGKHFIPIAEKWENLYFETQKIRQSDAKELLRVSNVDSLNESLMTSVCTDFLSRNHQCGLHLTTLRSDAAYEAAENHEIDLGLIMNPRFSRTIRTVPLFEENLSFVCSVSSDYKGPLVSASLDASDEVYIPWGNTFLRWHDYWFGPAAETRITMDHMALLERILSLDHTWAIVPATIAAKLVKTGKIRRVPLEDGPAPRTCYGILKQNEKERSWIADFIKEFIRQAEKTPEIRVLETSRQPSYE